MQDAFSTPYAIPRHQVSLPTASKPVSLVQRESDISLTHTLQSTLGVFVRHPLPVLACAFICFAGAGVIGSLLYGAMIGDAVLRTGSHTGATMRAYNTQMLLQAVLGAFLFLIGRSMLTWIALQVDDNTQSAFSTQCAEGKPVTIRAALRASLSQWPSLLFSTLLYGLFITLGLLGVSVMLREMRLDISNTRSLRTVDLSSILHWTLVRAISLMPPDPGSPFADWLAATRYNLARSAGVTNGSTYLGFDFARGAPGDVSSPALTIGLASIALLFTLEVLLCMRTAAIFSTHRRQDWLSESLRVSSAHFLRVAAWRWSLRLLIVALSVAMLVLPPAFHQAWVVGGVRQALSIGYWPYHIAQSANGVGVALVNGILIAFGIVFEARMYAALSHARH